MVDGQGRDAAWFHARMPEPELLRDLLTGDPVARLLDVAKDRAIADGSVVAVARSDADDAAVRAALSLAASAARLVSDQGPAAELSPEQSQALELFVLLVSRPALFVRNGDLAERPENWPELRRDSLLLPQTIAGVGRLEQFDGVRCGTGLLVGDCKVLTNNHVVCALLGQRLDFWQRSADTYARMCEQHGRAWERPDAERPRFELFGEIGSPRSSVAAVSGIVGHHPDRDLAVLALEREPAGARRLRLAAAEPASFRSRRVYAVGYPIDDQRTALHTRVTPAAIFQRIFGADDSSLGTKRLSPGVVVDWDGDAFVHDASTLPGSSGSCIVDFESRRVVGVHFGGSYRDRKNFAIPLFRLAKDEHLAGCGVVFEGAS
jgi:endonuclease G